MASRATPTHSCSPHCQASTVQRVRSLSTAESDCTSQLERKGLAMHGFPALAPNCMLSEADQERRGEASLHDQSLEPQMQHAPDSADVLKPRRLSLSAEAQRHQPPRGAFLGR